MIFYILFMYKVLESKVYFIIMAHPRPATFRVLSSHTWLVHTLLDSTTS